MGYWLKSQLRATRIILDSKDKDPSEITLHIHGSDSLMIFVIEKSKMVKKNLRKHDYKN